MDDSSPKVSDTELAILDVLWKGGACQARAITETLYPGGSRKSATVHSLLERLERKGLVERDRKTYPHTFQARIGRDEYVAGELQRMASQVFAGDLAPILMNLAGSAELTEAERRRILALLDKSKDADQDGDEEAAS